MFCETPETPPVTIVKLSLEPGATKQEKPKAKNIAENKAKTKLFKCSRTIRNL